MEERARKTTLYSKEGPFGYRAPSTMQLRADEHVDLDMFRLRELEHIANTSDSIAAVRTVLDGSITDITITTAEEADKAQAEQASKPVPKPKPAKPGMEREVQSEPQRPVSARDAMRARTRSNMYAQWGLKARRVWEIAGFIPCTAQPNRSPQYRCIADTDKMIPCVLDLQRLSRITVKVDVYGMYEWHFYRFTGVHPQTEEEIPNVIVLGDETDWPTSNGQLRSLMSRLVLSDAYVTYKHKLATTITADERRAQPRLITQTVPGGSASASALTDPDMVTTFSAITVRNDKMDFVPMNLTAEQRAEVNACADRVAWRNQTRNEPGPIANMEDRSERVLMKRKDRTGESEYRIAVGQALAPGAHLAEAPADLLPARQGWLEMISLGFRVPLSMFSSGDATGKAKLNAETAGPETSRLYLEAQKERRRSLETQISAMYAFMYAPQRVWDKINHTLTASNALPTDEELNEETLAAGSVIVCVSGAIEPDACMSLHERGIMTYQAVADHLCRYYHVPATTWEAKPLIDVKDLAGIAQPKPAEDSSSKKPAKKKAKSK